MKKSDLLISVVIPNWNGEKLLRRNLPSVLESVPQGTEVIIIENGSTDQSARYLKTLGNKVRVIKNKENLGFIKGCNQGVQAASNELVLLLNNDVKPEKGFLVQVIKDFQDEKVFAVSLNESGDKWAGWAQIMWYDGYFNYQPGGVSDKAHITGWASGGGAVFRKSMWNQLGGFDEIYDPFYWEDTDLGYRAWKNGWKVLWESKATVHHQHESTISKLDRHFVNLVKERNQLLFIWKNITDRKLIFTHYLGMLLRIATGPNYIKVIISALKRYKVFGFPKTNENAVSDIDIFKMFSGLSQ